MVVQHNMNAINAYNRLNANVAGLKKASEKLSSGYRINRAGDDAAGLAISEKMRSQIKGLNQAVRNSQDGINMIQTFEGAAQETHSILQRMKELAVESANGTYDNATDRAAIQLEFEQLNDELNQIADTDFNGTIVLNGGVMADGLKAEDGEFNYAKAAEALKAFAKGEDIAAQLYNDNDAAHGILRNQNYGADAAKALWDALGINVDDTDAIDITFVYDNGEWKASVVMGKEVDVPGDPTTYKKAWNETAGSFGGTTYTFTDDDLKALIDANDWNGTDNIYITTGGALTTTAAGNVTLTLSTTNVVDQEGTDDTYKFVDITDKLKMAGIEIKPSELNGNTGNGGFTVSWTGKDADGNVVTYDVNAVFDAYPAKAGDHITLSFTNSAESTYAPNNIDVLEDSLTSSLGAFGDAADGSALSKTDISIKVTLGEDITDENMDALMEAALKELADIEITWDGTKFVLNGETNVQLAADGKSLEYVGADGTTTITLATIDLELLNGAALGTGEEITFQLKAADFNLADLEQISAHAVNTSDDAWAAAQAKAAGASGGVTKANAFDNSTARMTYADHIILQTGARTKDAVDFTFAYNTDGSADMGNLLANLDLSARANGLNTANLNLANQDDANYAIDQIDKAINKTSMVRATFGAIQNRLEHKITNLTTTAENLTEAESSIRDTDMASEMMNFTKYNILQQAAQSMLAQANQQPQSILQLLG